MADIQQPPQEAVQVAKLPPKSVIYCGVCSLPPEYCEFGGTTSKCADWLKAKHPDLHEQFYSEETINANLSTLSVEARARAEKDAQKKAAKAVAADKKDADRKAHAKVTIKRVERNKRKYVTEVYGLEQYDLELKKIAKEFGKKFAAGASVSKAAGDLGEFITVQGDLSVDIEEWLIDNYEVIPEDNIELVEDKKKKAAAPVV